MILKNSIYSLFYPLHPLHLFSETASIKAIGGEGWGWKRDAADGIPKR